MSNTSKAIKGVSSQTIVTLVLGVVEIVSFSIMSRLLTQEDFGYYAAITAITVVFSTFSETGIGSAIIQQKELTSRYVNNAFTISLLFGSLISFLLLVLASPLASSVADESMTTPLMLMSVTLLLNCLTSVNISLMYRKLQFLRVGIISLISLVVTTIVAIILAYKGYGYYAIISKAILTSIITWILSFILCKTNFGFALDWETFKKIFSFSGWLMASVLFRNLAHQVDRLLMPRLLSVSALGAYNRPQEFANQISNKITGVFDTALFPVLSGIQDNKTALRNAFQRSMYVMNIFALLLTFAFFFNSGLLIRVFFGNQWINLKPVMMVISWSLLFNMVGRLSDCYLRSLALTKQQFYFRVFETVLNTAGVLIGFKWDIIGIAMSIVITNIIAKMIKIIYVGGRIDIKALEIVWMIVSPWKYALILFPVCALPLALLPNSIGGDIIMSVIFTVSVVIIFLFFPKFIGKPYQEEVYSRIVSFFKKKLHRK